MSVLMGCSDAGEFTWLNPNPRKRMGYLNNSIPFSPFFPRVFARKAVGLAVPGCVALVTMSMF